MSQLNVYVPDEIEAKIRLQAKKSKKSISKYITDLFTRQSEQKSEWHKDFFTKVTGKWQGELKQIPRPEPDEVEGL